MGIRALPVCQNLRHPRLSVDNLSFLACVVTLLFLLSAPVRGALVNATIDDQYGDSRVLSFPTYSPRDGGYWQGPECGESCLLRPNEARVLNGSWHATTYRDERDSTSRRPRVFSFQFTGVALYVFLILPPYRDPGITTLTEVNFTVDGGEPSFFRNVPLVTDTDFRYQHLAYHIDGLDHRTHLFTGSMDSGPANYETYLNFDYAIYTYDNTLISSTPAALGPISTSDTTPSSSSQTPGPPTSTQSTGLAALGRDRVGAIAGGVVGGAVILVIIIAFCIYVVRRRKQSKHLHDGLVPRGYMSPHMPAPAGHLDAMPFTYEQPPLQQSGISLGAIPTTRSGMIVGQPSAWGEPRTAPPSSGGGGSSTNPSTLARETVGPVGHTSGWQGYEPVRKARDPPSFHEPPRSSLHQSHFSSNKTVQRSAMPQTQTLRTGSSSVQGTSAGTTAIESRIERLQTSIATIETSIEAEETALRNAGMSASEIDGNVALGAMKDSLRAMKTQMERLEVDAGRHPPLYES